MMRVESVEIYSESSNGAILRHPDRRFPGVLIQGDALWSLCHMADVACVGSWGKLNPGHRDQLNE